MTQTCVGGVAINSWFGTGSSDCNGTAEASWPAYLTCNENGHNDNYGGMSCLGVADGNGVAWAEFTDSACTANVSEIHSNMASCSCSTGWDTIVGSNCHRDLCLSSSPLCNSKAACEASFGWSDGDQREPEAMCVADGEICACKHGHVEKEGCYGGVRGRIFFEGSACSGEVAVFEDYDTDECRPAEQYHKNEVPTAQSVIDNDCAGVADFGMSMRRYYSDTACSTLIESEGNGRDQCECARETPKAPRDWPSGCDSTGEALEGCHMDGGPLSGGASCAAGCITKLDAYAQLGCEYSAMIAMTLDTCGEEVQKSSKLTFVKSLPDADCTIDGATKYANAAISVGDGCFPQEWGSSKVTCTSTTTATWISYPESYDCSATDAPSMQTHIVKHGCNVNAYSSSDGDQYLYFSIPWCADSTATPTAPVVLPAYTLLTSFSADLTGDEITAVTAAYCSTVTASTGITQAKLVCAMEAQTAVCGANEKCYTLSAWASPVEAALSSTVTQAQFEAAANTAVTAADTGGATLTKAGVDAMASTTKPAGADEIMAVGSGVVDTGFSAAPRLAPVGLTLAIALVLALV